MSINNYIKVISVRPNAFDQREAGFHLQVGAVHRVEQYWFFDDRDPVSIAMALRNVSEYIQRNGFRNRALVSVYRRLVGKDVPEVGAPSAPIGMRAA